MTPNTRRGLKVFIVSLFGTLFLLLLVAAGWVIRLDNEIRERLAQKRFLPPVEFYSGPMRLSVGMKIPEKEIQDRLQSLHFRSREFGAALQAGDYSQLNPEQCRATLGSETPAEWQISICWLFRNRISTFDDLPLQAPQLVVMDSEKGIVAAYRGQPLVPGAVAVLEPLLFAQYYGDKPVLRRLVELGDVPPNCLNGLISIEDSGFLDHSGVSLTGIFRAFITNVRAGGARQGGSTLTQQLVKNYFLTDERTLKRKVTEIAMAVLLESRATKDEILETYVNLIYMGQSGPFEVRGFGAAAEYYFSKSLADLNLSECSMIAALVNGPGVFDPFSKPDKALKRRAKVLDRMTELNYINLETAEAAKKVELPLRKAKIVNEPAPYFVASARRWIHKNNIDTKDGLRVFTTLNPTAQEAAQAAVRSGLEKLETTNPAVKKLKEAGKKLEGILVSVDPITGWIEAIVGGRGYLSSPFNRVYDAHRQVGSTMKPLVYLTALLSGKTTDIKTKQESAYTPLSLVEDTSFTHRYEGQAWTPKNYDNKYHGRLPIYWALKESLNVPTARLGIDIGLDKIVDTARKAGIVAPLEPLPALTLGAFEIAPSEMVQAYTTLARFGSKVETTPVLTVQSLDGKILWSNPVTAEQVFDPKKVAMLIGMMKETIRTGTARGLLASGYTKPVAGKTGTTNDKRDAWFVGLVPQHVTVVWIGYDDNTSHNLTGSAAASTLWLNYMTSYGSRFSGADFAWPEGVASKFVTRAELEALGITDQKALSEARVAPPEEPSALGSLFGIKPTPPPSSTAGAGANDLQMIFEN
jgi:penicillin-binding protein 1B